VEDALHLAGSGLGSHQIEIVREFQTVPAIVSDRHKVLQILVNLIANAELTHKECYPEGRFRCGGNHTLPQKSLLPEIWKRP